MDAVHAEILASNRRACDVDQIYNALVSSSFTLHLAAVLGDRERISEVELLYDDTIQVRTIFLLPAIQV